MSVVTSSEGQEVKPRKVSSTFCLINQHGPTQMDEDDLLAFGDLEIEEDTSVADARAARIAAARAQAKQYSAKIEEPGVSAPSRSRRGKRD